MHTVRCLLVFSCFRPSQETCATVFRMLKVFLSLINALVHWIFKKLESFKESSMSQQLDPQGKSVCYCSSIAIRHHKSGKSITLGIQRWREWVGIKGLKRIVKISSECLETSPKRNGSSSDLFNCPALRGRGKLWSVSDYKCGGSWLGLQAYKGEWWPIQTAKITFF